MANRRTVISARDLPIRSKLVFAVVALTCALFVVVVAVFVIVVAVSAAD